MSRMLAKTATVARSTNSPTETRTECGNFVVLTTKRKHHWAAEKKAWELKKN